MGTRNKSKKFEERLVLFIDFLGFKEIVENTANDSQKFDHLIEALKAIGEIAGDKIHKSERLTQFSDSIVLSYRVNEESGVFWLLQSMAETVVRLTRAGYLLRGGITVGKLYHTKKFVFGPAMNRAYHLESKLAKYPRVIADPIVIETARIFRSDLHDEDEEEAYIRDFLLEDTDGQLYFEYVDWRAVVAVTGEPDRHYPAYLMSVARTVQAGLSHDDVCVQEKYLWLYKRYRDARRKFVKIPDDHPYMNDFPGARDAIKALPTLRDMARLAQKRVKARDAATAPST